ncbi:translation initiation factor eIF-3b [Calocera viscosa TUFC12733]|uniref:Eukaryotic translation initiation factor 3 subunit B n=1 Tax=Calocera viscosa (strain TUFC12733) TaxID=1330018 RepID=A0A167LTI1_CALVF|nr:translation initiation factor eIF-3b [Calocera viscosa TUFC12733]
MPVPEPSVNGHLHSAYDSDEDIDYTDIDEKYAVEYDESFLDSIIVVDGIPIVKAERKERLVTKLGQDFKRLGAAFKPGSLHMPWDDEKGQSKGYIFIEYPTVDQAAFAIAAIHGYRFDKNHTFTANRFADIEKFTNMEETYVEPPQEEFKPREHLRAWLGDQQGRDQYVTLRGDDLQVFWNGRNGASELVIGRPRWTESYVAWSPAGTFMATFHIQGVQFWGGPSWNRARRLVHPHVKLLDFSPGENYVVTWSNEPIQIPENARTGPDIFSADDEGNSVAVWDLKSGFVLRTFPSGQQGEDGAPKKMIWPLLKWTGDDRYVGRVQPGQQISVYELPGMHLVDKKSIKVEGVQDFEWCPWGDRDRDDQEGKTKGKKARENILAYWTPEVVNQPARVSLMSFPSRTQLRSKNLFNVSDCKLHWQNQGDFLCVKVDRHTRTKKSLYCNLEIFRMREKDYPVEVLEIKDTVISFSWEPRGERFCIITTNDPNFGNTAPGSTIKTAAHFYQLERGKGDFRLLKTVDNKTSNAAFWSPKGRHVVLATMGSQTKFDLEFWDLDFIGDEAPRTDKDPGAGIQLLNTTEHYGVTDIEWDPSGRYVASSASAWRHTLENGYTIWDFRGQELSKQVLDRFKQFLWRPRPRTLLSKEQQREIRKKLREYSKQFDEEDAAEESSVSAELIAARRRLIDEWNAWRTKVKRELKEEKGKRQQERGHAQEKVEEYVDEIIEETIEEVLE